MEKLLIQSKTTVVTGTSITSENISSKPSLGIYDGLVLTYQYFTKKMFTNLPSVLILLSIAVTFNWSVSHFWPNPEELLPYAIIIAADVLSAIWRDVRRGLGFSSRKLAVAVPAFVGYFIIIYALLWVGKMTEKAGVDFLKDLHVYGYIYIMIAHLKSFIKNMVIAKSFKKGIATWIYNNVDVHKNKIMDTLWSQYAKKKGLDKSD